MREMPQMVSEADQARSATVAQSRDTAYERAKRITDVVVSCLATILLLPLWALISLAIILTSPGPAIFLQRRVVGKDGKEFTVFKFRTMHVNSDDKCHQKAIAKFVRSHEALSVIGKPNLAHKVYKLVHDPRVTPIGRFLRKTGLDEAPQFLNVLRGEMSVVGPRAPLRYEYELYNDWARQRLRVLPGITGWYQIKGRSMVPFDEMVRLDLHYIQNRSLWLDIKIMLVTPWVMVIGRGGY